MTEKEINAEQMKLLKYLKKFYPSKEIDITNFFKKATAKYEISDRYLYDNVYSHLQDKFVDINLGSFMFGIPSFPYTIKATLKEEGYNYLNSIPVSTQDKRKLLWFYPLLIISFTGFMFEVYKTFILDPNQNQELLNIERQLPEKDSVINIIQLDVSTIKKSK